MRRQKISVPSSAIKSADQKRSIGNWYGDGLAFLGVAAQAGKIGACKHKDWTGPGCGIAQTFSISDV
jgi:hypothetical protein